MKTYLYIGIGGFAGAVLRYIIKSLYFNQGKETQWGTLFINISGCFLIALILTITSNVLTFDIKVRNTLTIVLLGAYTTFSGFCKDVINLISMGNYFLAMLYILLSIVLGIGVIYLGYFFTKSIVLRLVSKSNLANKELVNLDVEID
jgi:CrcB protein